MAYELYMGKMLCPVAPSKIQIKIKNQNKSMNLINGEEITLLNSAGLSDITFDLLLPNVKYPFAVYKSGFQNAKVYLDEIERLKVEKSVFQLKIVRTFPNGKMLFDTDIKVTLEDYTIKEDAKQGFDVVVSVSLKQFRQYGTKIYNIVSDSGQGEVTASAQTVRETENSPEPKENTVKTYTVVKGDSLWNIAKKFYGDGSKYTLIKDANGNPIKNASLIYPGQVLTIPNASDAVASTGGSSKTTKTTKTTKTSGTSGTSTQRYILTIINTGATTRVGNYSGTYRRGGMVQSLGGTSTMKQTVECDKDSTAIIQAVPNNGYRATISGGTKTPKMPGNPGDQVNVKMNSNKTVTISWSRR